MAIDAHWYDLRPNFAPTEGQIHVYQASLDLDPETLQNLEVTLSAEEKCRADRFIFPRDRDHFVAARGILRELLGLCLQRPPSEISFAFGPQGKPFLSAHNLKAPLYFNTSHSHGLALYALSPTGELGIDLELLRSEVACEDIAERYFSKQELAELQALPESLRTEGFFLCWTRKEAYVKARGAGLQISLDSFNVSLTPGGNEELQAPDSQLWSIYSFQPAPQYVAALVAPSPKCSLQFWRWKPKR